jgi:hypothetical protein
MTSRRYAQLYLVEVVLMVVLIAGGFGLALLRAIVE